MREAYHHGDLRNGLIETGLNLVETAGADGFSLREAARNLGVTANAAYRHFADKSDLLTAIAAHGFVILSDRLRESLAAAGTDSAAARLRIVSKTYVGLAVERPALFRLMFGPHGLRQIMRLPQVDPDATAGQILNAILDDLVAEGRMSAIARNGALLRVWSAIHGFALLALDGLDGLDTLASRDAALHGMTEFVLKGLCDREPG